MSAIRCEGLIAGYGKVPIVHGVDLSVEPGEILALLGPNGSGKTTLMLTLAGLLPALGGTVHLGERALPNGKPVVANRSGLVLVPDDRALFTALSVRQNLELTRRRGGPTIDEMVEMFPAIGRRLSVSAGAVSGGEQQMIALARALMQQPRVLLVDEMSLGLAPVIVEGLLPMLRTIAESSVAVVLVEQHVHLALELADRAAVLTHGSITLSGPASTFAAEPSLLERAYLGELSSDDIGSTDVSTSSRS